MTASTISAAQADFLDRLRTARDRLAGIPLHDPALAFCAHGLKRVETSLTRPLRVVVLGEYNSGKTSVADLLIGNGLLPTSVVSNTHVPVLISYAPKAAIYGVLADETRVRIDSEDDDDPLTDLTYDAVQVSLPIDALERYQILDTPSLVSPATFVADADIVIWCTVATRAWTESERVTWSSLPRRADRNAILVATHKDGLDTAEDEARVAERLRSVTEGMFRDIVFVAADNAHETNSATDPAETGGPALRASLTRIADDITTRRARKAEKIVRRLARLTFHHLAMGDTTPQQTTFLKSWELGAGRLVDMLEAGAKTPPAVIEELLTAYAFYAERMRPGVIAGDGVPAEHTSRALTAPIRWPHRNAAAARLIRMLVADLTGILRVLAASTADTDPTLAAARHAARATVLDLADLDGAFAALERMLGAAAERGQAAHGTA